MDINPASVHLYFAVQNNYLHFVRNKYMCVYLGASSNGTSNLINVKYYVLTL